MGKENLKKYIDADNCPVRNVLDRFGDKWSTLIILILGESKVLRFNELQNAIGTISQKMLTVTLKKLEADDLVNRTIYPQIPPKVEYNLTERGKSLLPHIQNIVAWANENMEGITQSRMSI
ncbi:MAG: transcriptional regulator [Cytophagaceae bacterium]|nr:transcriptional regulator [Cytophagaceae bacterium]|tara:strand:+ start:261 stop:623 length:363 start_codon:yes stop_codon:yes gene_type:complete